jgi:hypothetical protein
LQKDGNKLPGKKGIMLTHAQLQLIATHAAAVMAAVLQKNLGYELDLGDK